MTNTKKDIITAIIFLTFGIFLLVQSYGIKTVVTSNYEVGSGFVPSIISTVIIIFAIILLASTLLRKHTNDNPRKAKTVEDSKGGLLTILLLIFYSVVFDKLGFFISTFIYLFLQILLLSNGENRKPKFFLVFSIGATIIIYIVFNYAFQLQLPAGIINI